MWIQLAVNLIKSCGSLPYHSLHYTSKIPRYLSQVLAGMQSGGGQIATVTLTVLLSPRFVPSLLRAGKSDGNIRSATVGSVLQVGSRRRMLAIICLLSNPSYLDCFSCSSLTEESVQSRL